MFSFDFEEERKPKKAGSSGSTFSDDFDDDDDEYSTDEEALKKSLYGSVSSTFDVAKSLKKEQEIIYNIGDVDLVSKPSPPKPQLPSTAARNTRESTGKSGISNVVLSNYQAALAPPASTGTSKAPSAASGTISKINKSDFELLKVIGKGAYGKVFLVRKATGIDSGTYYAMKVLKKASLVIQAKDAEHTRTERSILEDVRHPFIVRLFYAFQTDFKLYLILDYASGGELFMYLEKQKMFLEDTAMFYIAELVLALEHLHSYGIIYRDLKPENVLLDYEGHVKLTDFGLSKVALHENKTNTVCGTIEYMAPEVIANIAYDKSVDWWSLGALAYDMLTGSPPFTSNNRKKTMDLIMNKKLSLPYFLTPDAKDLLTKLLRKSPLVRLGHDNTEAIKKHRLFKTIDWNKLLNRDITPPITPKVNGPEDVDNFHSAFTSMPVVDSPAETVKDDVFSGFSFVASCVLDRFEDLYHRNRQTTTKKPSPGQH